MAIQAPPAPRSDNRHVKLAIAGAAGRMGRAIAEAASADPDFSIVCAFDAAAAGESVGRVKIVSDAAAVAQADVVLDFTRPEGTLALLKHAKAMVIGTTGFSPEDRNRISEAAQRIPIVLAANFAVGVNTVYKLAETAARILGDAYDIEIIEAHHRHKVDAPSGTALQLGHVVAKALGRDLEKNAVFGRMGDVGERKAKEIGFHALRGGDISPYAWLAGVAGAALESWAQREALAVFESLGARPMVERVRRQLRSAGVRGIPRGPRQESPRLPCRESPRLP